MLRTLAAALPLLALTPLAPAARAADQDGVVEWGGVSHLGWHDREPAVPLRGEAFRVRFQARRGDLTSARVRVTVGTAAPVAFEAAVLESRGPYDVWAADVPGVDARGLRYDVALTDGADTDYLGSLGVGEHAPVGPPFALDFDTLAHAPLGATVVTGGVVFRVWAPNAPTAHVRGTFNNWSLATPMTRLGEDFVALVPGAAAGDEYKFYFSATSTWKPDAFARQVDPDEYTNSVVVDPRAYAWSSPPFEPPPFERMVCYQLHVGTFAGRNDPYGPAPSPSRFVDVAARADHLAELGVNVVYLNPVIEWPGDFSGGYNPICHTALESALGTPDDFRTLVDALHARGIAVILDVVWNHLDGGGTYLGDYTGPGAANEVWFDSPAAATPWGPQLDLDHPRIRQAVLEHAASLLEEYRLDGFRVDALSAFTWGPQPSASNQLLRDLNNLMDRRYADKLCLGEVFGDDPWFTRPVAAGGLGFDSQYHTAYKDAVRAATFDAAFGSADVGALAWAATRGGGEELQGVRAFDYFELHDDAWPLNGHRRAVRDIDPSAPHDDRYASGRTKLAHGVTLLAKGVPALLMGTEWLEDAGWEYEKIDWSHRTTYAGVFEYYKDLIRLRTSEPALFADAGARVLHVDEAADVLAFERYDAAGDSWVVVANWSNADFAGAGARRVGLPHAGTWGVALNSEDAAYMGRGVGSAGYLQAQAVPAQGSAWSALLDLPAHGFLLLQHDPPGAPGATSYCTPGAFGATMALAAGASLDVTTNDFTLEAHGVPSTVGLFFFGSAAASAPFGDCATLCVGGASGLLRLKPAAAASGGLASRRVDLTLAPGDVIAPGSTWHFQYYFRHGAACSAGFDATDGLRVVFGP